MADRDEDRGVLGPTWIADQIARAEARDAEARSRAIAEAKAQDAEEAIQKTPPARDGFARAVAIGCAIGLAFGGTLIAVDPLALIR